MSAKKIVAVEPAVTWLANTQTINGARWLVGRGPIPAKLMFVGDNPRSDDIQTNSVFSGPAGKVFFEYARQHGIDVYQAYLTNAVKMKPVGDKASVKEIKLCQPLLFEEIKRVAPEFIICLGTTALQAVLGTGAKMAASRGVLVQAPQFAGAGVYAMYSPAHKLRDPRSDADFQRDWRRLSEITQHKAVVTDTTAFTVINTLAGLEGLRDYILSPQGPKTLALDCEWQGMHWQDPKGFLRTIQLGLEIGSAVVIELRDEQHNLTMPPDKVLPLITPILANPAITLVGHNMISDGEQLLVYGVDIRPTSKFDTMLAEHTINETGPFGLEALTMKYTRMGRYDIELEQYVQDHLGGDRARYGDIPSAILMPYAAKDVDAVLRIMEVQKPLMADFMVKRGNYPSLWDTVMDTQRVLYELEREGMQVDVDRLNQLTDIYQAKYANMRNVMLAAVAAQTQMQDYNPGSDDDNRALLFEHLKLTPVESTKGVPWNRITRLPLDKQKAARPSTDKRTLEILQDKHPLVRQLRNLRKIEYVCRTWLRTAEDTKDCDVNSKAGGLRAKIWPDGHLHPHISQLKETGRFSSSKPNCFPGFVEVLTEHGWVQFKHVNNWRNKHLKLAQYDTATGRLSFVAPIGYINRVRGDGSERMVELTHPASGRLLACTHDHRVLWRTPFGECHFQEAGKISELPGDAQFVHAGLGPEDGEDLSDDAATVIAAGLHYHGIRTKRQNSIRGGIRLTAPADERAGLKQAVEALALPCIKRRLKPEQKHRAGVPALQWTATVRDALEKRLVLGTWVYRLGHGALSGLYTKLHNYGCYGASCNLMAADIPDYLQYVALATGHTAYLGAKPPVYGVQAYNKDYTPMTRYTRHTRELNGPVYCVTMPLGTIVVRCSPHSMPLVIGQCQNWPKKAEGDLTRIFGAGHQPPLIRSIIVPAAGHVLLEADWKQAELFILAALAKDDIMMGALTTPGKDLHDMTAISAFNLQVKDEAGMLVPEQALLDLAGRDYPAFEKYIKMLRYVDMRGNVMDRGTFKDTIRVSAKNLQVV